MSSKRHIFFILAIASIAVTLSCASKSSLKKDVNPSVLPAQVTESSRQVKAMNDNILIRSLSSGRDFYRDYKIGPEDLLEISVFEEEKLNKTVRVSSQGNISLPLLGILRVKGLTANELEKEVRDLLAEKYFQDPHVSVFIKEYRNQRISVIGAVEKPGAYDVTGQKTILDVLGLAGGLKEDAGQLLFLIRSAKPEERLDKDKGNSRQQVPQTFVVDLEELLIRGDLTLNLPLMHGDVINVPVSGKIFVGGEVRSPGGFPLKGKRLTVSQAIALAGGLKTEAAGSDTMIFRYSEKGTGKEIISANVYSIQKGQAEDLYLRENDIVMVPRSGAKAMGNELWDFIKGRIGGVSFGGAF
jgi:polysaccharide export outer membrane protein